MSKRNPKDVAAQTKVPVWAVPPVTVIAAAETFNIEEYGAFNWRYKPISMLEHLGGLERHLLALKDGEDLDRKSGKRHFGHIIAGAGIMLDAGLHGTLIDDRHGQGPGPDLMEAFMIEAAKNQKRRK